MRARARFIPPMLLVRTDTLPDDTTRWQYELKLDGYRAIAFRADDKRAELRSRNDKDLGARYPAVVKALASLPADTVIDGEIVALDENGRPSFNRLQHAGASKRAPVLYFVFDVLILGGRDVRREPLAVRRTLLAEEVLPTLSEPIRDAAPLAAPLPVLIASARSFGFEGLIAKRLDSEYESDQRTGAWRKMRLNQGQEFVIGGYTVGATMFDALIVGYYEASRLMYVARTRAGFTPASRAEVWRKMRAIETNECPFVNLPESPGGHWGRDSGLTAEKMSACRWVKPLLVAQIEYVEWTEDNHLRHSQFIGLRDDKDPRAVVRERAAERERE